MDSKAARVQIEEIERLKKKTHMTLLIDGWEDQLKRSLYGSLAAKVGEYPTVLGLEDMTGDRGTANRIVDTATNSMTAMDIENGHIFIAATTDNPTLMQSVRSKLQLKFFWILVRALFT